MSLDGTETWEVGGGAGQPAARRTSAPGGDSRGSVGKWVADGAADGSQGPALNQALNGSRRSLTGETPPGAGQLQGAGQVATPAAAGAGLGAVHEEGVVVAGSGGTREAPAAAGGKVRAGGGSSQAQAVRSAGGGGGAPHWLCGCFGIDKTVDT